MSLQIIYGPAGSGKSTMCIRLVEKYQGENVYFITPEQLSYTVEKRFAQRFGVISPQSVNVLSFKRLFFSTLQETGGLRLPPVTKTGKNILMRRVLQTVAPELSILKKTASFTGFTQVMLDTVSELKRYRVLPEGLLEAEKNLEEGDSLKDKLKDLTLIYRGFVSAVDERFSDTDDELTLLADLLEESPQLYENAYFFFDGFDGFTPQELKVIELLLVRCAVVTVTLCSDSGKAERPDPTDLFAEQKRVIYKLYGMAQRHGVEIRVPTQLVRSAGEKPDLFHLEQVLYTGKAKVYSEVPENLEIAYAENPYTELEYVCTKILGLISHDGRRYRDIVVATNDLERYRYVIDKVFGSFGIPVFLDRKTTIADQPAAQMLVLALDIAITSWRSSAVFSYLKSGFTNLELEDIDLIENYILATGIRGSTWTRQEDWSYTPQMAKSFSSPEEFLQRINEIRRQVVQPLQRLHSSVKAANSAGEMCQAMYEFVKEIHLEEKIMLLIERFRQTSAEAAARYGQMWNALMDILDEIYDVCGTQKVSVAEFRDMLVTGMEAHEIGIIPTNIDSVTIADCSYSKLDHPPVLFLIGMDDKHFPRAAAQEGLLSDRDRERLEEMEVELAPDSVFSSFC